MTTSSLFSDAFLTGSDDRFLSKQLSNDVVCVDVDQSQIEGLLSWQDLNEVLATRPLQPPRLRLHRRGVAVPVDTYTEQVEEAGEQRRVVRPTSLYSQLREGASLILDAIDRLHPPIRDAADDLMGMVHERVQANLYLLRGASFGFDTHWDDHDTFIVQVAGTKSWTVHGPGRHYPMKVDKDQTHVCPDEIAWEGVLHSGQILHVPRGWWHTVKGTGDVSAHLTFGFTRTTGIDWAQSLIEHLYEHEVFRRDIPRFESSEAREAHQRSLTENLLELVGQQSFDTYLLDRDARFPRRQRFALPWTVDDSAELTDTCSVEFAPIVAPTLRAGPDKVTVSMLGKSYTFAPTVAPILELLARRRMWTIGELGRSSGVNSEQVGKIIRALAQEQIVFVVA